MKCGSTKGQLKVGFKKAEENRINRGYEAYQNRINRGYEAYQNRINKLLLLGGN